MSVVELSPSMQEAKDLILGKERGEVGEEKAGREGGRSEGSSPSGA